MPPESPGEPWTAEELIERFGDFVYRFALRLTSDREEARDLAQDSFVMILRGAGSYRGEASPAAWIGKVVLNCHRNRRRWWRRLRRGPTISLDAAPPGAPEGASLVETLADPADDPETTAMTGERLAGVQAALARLPIEQRAILLLREVEGFSYLEIARALGVAEGTVKSRLSRARQALRAAMEPRSEEEDR